jgi:hypothetical protein
MAEHEMRHDAAAGGSAVPKMDAGTALHRRSQFEHVARTMSPLPLEHDPHDAESYLDPRTDAAWTFWLLGYEEAVSACAALGWRRR